MDKDKKIELLKQKIDFIDDLVSKVDYSKLRQWREETLIILDNLISEDSKYYSNFGKIIYERTVSFSDESDEESRMYEKKSYLSGLEKAKSSLQAIIFGIQNDLF